MGQDLARAQRLGNPINPFRGLPHLCGQTRGRDAAKLFFELPLLSRGNLSALRLPQRPPDGFLRVVPHGQATGLAQDLASFGRRHAATLRQGLGEPWRHLGKELFAGLLVGESLRSGDAVAISRRRRGQQPNPALAGLVDVVLGCHLAAGLAVAGFGLVEAFSEGRAHGPASLSVQRLSVRIEFTALCIHAWLAQHALLVLAEEVLIQLLAKALAQVRAQLPHLRDHAPQRGVEPGLFFGGGAQPNGASLSLIASRRAPLPVYPCEQGRGVDPGTTQSGAASACGVVRQFIANHAALTQRTVEIVYPSCQRFPAFGFTKHVALHCVFRLVVYDPFVGSYLAFRLVRTYGR